MMNRVFEKKTNILTAFKILSLEYEKNSVSTQTRSFSGLSFRGTPKRFSVDFFRSHSVFESLKFKILTIQPETASL